MYRISGPSETALHALGSNLKIASHEILDFHFNGFVLRMYVLECLFSKQDLISPQNYEKVCST